MCYHIVAARMGSTVPACSTVPRTPWYGILSCSRCLQHLYLLAWSCRRDGAFVGDDRPGLGWAGLGWTCSLQWSAWWSTQHWFAFASPEAVQCARASWAHHRRRLAHRGWSVPNALIYHPCHAMPCHACQVCIAMRCPASQSISTLQ